MWHAGGANVTTDQERMGLFISHQVSYLRPQEMQLLAIPPEVARHLPHKLQRLIGYHTFGLGVDGRDPLEVLADGIVVIQRLGRPTIGGTAMVSSTKTRAMQYSCY